MSQIKPGVHYTERPLQVCHNQNQPKHHKHKVQPKPNFWVAAALAVTAEILKQWFCTNASLGAGATAEQ